MTETVQAPDFDWAEITGQAVKRLKKRKVKPCPAPIVRQAQRSWDGVPNPENDGELLHVLEHVFPTEERAAEFAGHMRNAGAHTVPPTSVSALIDPDEDGSTRLVRWRAGARRGAQAN